MSQKGIKKKKKKFSSHLQQVVLVPKLTNAFTAEQNEIPAGSGEILCKDFPGSTERSLHGDVLLLPRLEVTFRCFTMPSCVSPQPIQHLQKGLVC